MGTFFLLLDIMIFWDYEQITQVLFIIGDKVNLTEHARSGFNFNKTEFTDQRTKCLWIKIKDKVKKKILLNMLP